MRWRRIAYASEMGNANVTNPATSPATVSPSWLKERSRYHAKKPSDAPAIAQRSFARSDAGAERYVAPSASVPAIHTAKPPSVCTHAIHGGTAAPVYHATRGHASSAKNVRYKSGKPRQTRAPQPVGRSLGNESANARKPTFARAAIANASA